MFFGTVMLVASTKWESEGQEQLQLQLQTPADKKYSVNSGSIAV